MFCLTIDLYSGANHALRIHSAHWVFGGPDPKDEYIDSYNGCFWFYCVGPTSELHNHVMIIRKQDQVNIGVRVVQALVI